MTTDDLAGILAEHIGITFNDGSVFCSGCKQMLFEPGMYVTMLGGHSIGESVAVAHVAAVIAAAGWRQGREEWGYVDDPICPIEMWSEDDARKAAERHGLSVFRRYSASSGMSRRIHRTPTL